MPNEVDLHSTLHFSFFKTRFLLVWCNDSVICFWSASIFQRLVADEQTREGKNWALWSNQAIDFLCL